MSRILIGCARSGVLARAFRAVGWEAWECDTEPTRDAANAQWHIQGDLLAVDPSRFDMAIIHPPCTYLSVSGLHWNKRRPERAALTAEAIEFFKACWTFVESVGAGCLENPVGCMSSIWGRPDQYVQPYDFGDDASKKTCLWLHELPLLIADPIHRLPGRVVGRDKRGRMIERWDNQTDSGQNRLGPSDDRAEKRAETYPGIATAMAAQWGNA